VLPYENQSASHVIGQSEVAVRSLMAQDWMFFGLAYLAVKHALADFFLQTKYQYTNKGVYGHPGGLLHVLIHVALSAPLLWILAPTAPYGALILGAEFVVHYHCDWVKEKIVKRNGWSFTNNNYWRAMGIDQLVHGLTYLGMVRALV
jgi:Protein of unknown function (DUF3307)